MGNEYGFGPPKNNDGKVELICSECGLRARVTRQDDQANNVPICCGGTMSTATRDLQNKFPDGKTGYCFLSGKRLD